MTVSIRTICSSIAGLLLNAASESTGERDVRALELPRKYKVYFLLIHPECSGSCAVPVYYFWLKQLYHLNPGTQ